MWISEETVQERIRSSRNILNRVNRDESSPADYPVLTPDLPSEVLEGEVGDDESVESAAEFDAQSPDVESAENAARLAVLASMEDEVDPEVLKELRRTLVPRRPNLNKREAADAVIVGQLAGFNTAAALFDRSKRHLEQTAQFGNQSHQPGQYTPESALVKMIEEERTKIRNAAYGRLNYVLECMSNEKIQKVEKARDLAGIASQLAGVADKMLPRDMQNEDRTVFHVFRPEVKQQSDYEIVEVGEER